MVLVERDAAYASFGHAWAEVHDGSGWRVLDAALDRDTGALHYLPLGLLTDEGPGYAGGRARGRQGSWIVRLEILGSAEH
jgi:hypothetical protein